MNEIERAIEYLEPISKHPTMTGAYCEHLKVAIEALREQQKRSKGCKFCNEEYAVMSGNRMTRDAIHKGCTAKFCPMCGRKLKEVQA